MNFHWRGRKKSTPKRGRHYRVSGRDGPQTSLCSILRPASLCSSLYRSSSRWPMPWVTTLWQMHAYHPRLSTWSSLLLLQNIRRKQATSVKIITREHTTDSTCVVPRPSIFQRYQESLPFVPDPVLQEYLTEDLAYKANMSLAWDWHTYTSQRFPTSRRLEDIQRGQEGKVNQDSQQLSFFFSNMGNLLRHPGMGPRTMKWLGQRTIQMHMSSPTFFQLWARNWAHIRAMCESASINKE